MRSGRDYLDDSGLCPSDQRFGLENRQRETTCDGKRQPEETSRPHEEWSDRFEDGLKERESEATGYRCEGSRRSEGYDQIGNVLSTYFLTTVGAGWLRTEPNPATGSTRAVTS